MIYVILIILATGLALFIHNGEYVSLAPRRRPSPGAFVRQDAVWSGASSRGTGQDAAAAGLAMQGSGWRGDAANIYRPMNREQARNAVLEFAVYFLMAGVSACRIAVGNDYWVYRDNFKLIAQGRYVSSEIGFNLVVKGLVGIFGYDNYLPVFGFFSLITVFFFVRALHDQGSDFAFSLFLLFTEGYYFNSLNTVRYYLALAMALYAMKYVLKGEYLQFALFVGVGALFHKSILLVIPVYLLARYLAFGKWRKWYLAVGAAFLASLLFGQKLYRYIIFRFYPFYENSQFDQSRISYKNLALCLGTLAFAGFVYYLNRRKDADALNADALNADALNADASRADASKANAPVAVAPKESNPDARQGKGDRVTLFYVILSAFALLTTCCGSFVPEVTRVSYYMMISQVFLIPRLLGMIQNRKLQMICRVGCVLCFSLHFALLMRQMVLTDIRLLPYLNWIFN